MLFRLRPIQNRVLIWLLLFCTSAGVAVGQTTFSVCPSGCDFTTISDAINAAANGDIIEVTGNISEDQVNVTKSVTIDGLTGGRLLTSTSAVYGFEVFAMGVTIRNISVTGAGTFGIHSISGADNLTLENVTTNANGGTGIALNCTDGLILNDIVSTNNGGNGISLTNVQNVTITNITTSGNSFGTFGAGVGIFTTDAFCPSQTTSNVSIGGVVNISEVPAYYQQPSGPAVAPPTGTSFTPGSGSSTPSFTHTIGIAASLFPATDLNSALTGAADIIANDGSTAPFVWVAEDLSGDRFVRTGLASSGGGSFDMQIQPAISFAPDNSSINIKMEGGTYVGNADAVNSPSDNKDVVLQPGSSPGVVTISGNFAIGTGDQLEVDVDGPTPGSVVGVNHDQLIVSGTVDVTDAQLSIASSNAYTLSLTDEIIIISNTGMGAVIGQFAEGTSIAVGSRTAIIDYAGGDGNDISLRLDPCGDTPTGLNSRGQITLNTQTDLDNFVAANGEKYTQITGNLTVIGLGTGGDAGDPITDICNLSEIEEVTGSLTIRNFTSGSNPTEFTMDNLTTVGGNFSFGPTNNNQGNTVIITASFAALETVSGGVNVYNRNSTDDVLASIDLSSLETVGGSMNIRDNEALGSISLPALTSITASLTIRDNDAATMMDIGAVSGLTIGGGVTVQDNLALMDLNLMNLTDVDGPLLVQSNDVLDEINFANLASVGTANEDMTIQNNPLLTTLTCTALATVADLLRVQNNDDILTVSFPALTMIGDLDINNNNEITTITAPMLQAISGSLTIDGSNNNRQDDLTTITIGTGLDVTGALTINNNRSTDLASITLGLNTVGGNLTIDNDEFNTTTPGTVIDLSTLTSISGNLSIQEVVGGNLDLSALSSVAGNVNIANNDFLTSITAPAFSTVTGNFTINNNDAAGFVDLDGFSAISTSTFLGNLTVSGNANLDDCCVLSCGIINAVIAAGNNVNINNNDTGCANEVAIATNCGEVFVGNLTITSKAQIDNFCYGTVQGNLIIDGDEIADEANVINLAGMAGLTEVTGNLIIRDMSAMTGFGNNTNGLSNLTTVGGNIRIENNDALTNLNGLRRLANFGTGNGSTSSDLRIIGNGALTDLDGMGQSLAGGRPTYQVLDFYFNNNDAFEDMQNFSANIERDLNVNNNLEITDLGALTLLSTARNLEVRQNGSTGAGLPVSGGLTSLEGITNNATALNEADITQNRQLTTLEDLFPSGTSAEIAELRIRENNSLTDLGSASVEVTEVLVIQDQLLVNSLALLSLDESLVNLSLIRTGIVGTSPLSDLTELTGNLRIVNNDMLTDLIGLDAVTSIDALEIDGNDALTDLNDLMALTTITTSLEVTNNDLLAECCVLPCQVMVAGAEITAASPNPPVNISGNTGNCADLPTTVSACNISGVQLGIDAAICSGDVAAISVDNIPYISGATFTLEYTLTLPGGTTTSTLSESISAPPTNPGTSFNYDFTTTAISVADPADGDAEMLSLTGIRIFRTDEDGSFGCEEDLSGSPATVPVYDPIMVKSISYDPTSEKLCQGGDLAIMVELQGGDGSYTYAWTVDDTPANTFNTIAFNGATDAMTVVIDGSNILNTAATAEVTLTFGDGSSCTSGTESFSIMLSPQPMPNLNLTGSTAVCAGDSRTLTFGGTSIPDGSTVAFSAMPDVGSFSAANLTLPVNTTVFTLDNPAAGINAGDNITISAEVTTPDGCTATATQTLVFYPAIELTLSADAVVCLNETEGISVAASGGSGSGYTYTWTKVGGTAPGTASAVLSSTSIAAPDFTPAPGAGSGQTYIFNVTVTDDVGCTATSGNLTLTMDGPNSAQLSLQGGSPSQVCSNEDVDLIVTVNNPDYTGTYTIVFNDGTDDITVTDYTSGSLISGVSFDNDGTTNQNITFTLISVTEEEDNTCAVRSANVSGAVVINVIGEPELSNIPTPTTAVTSDGTSAGCTGEVSFTAPTITGGCMPISGTITYDPALPTGQTTFSSGESITQEFPIGTTTVTFTVTDGNNNSDTDMTFTVMVTDDEAPEITNPVATSMVVDCIADTEIAPLLPTVSDNCDGILNPGAPTISSAPSCEGDVTYTYTYTDAAGLELVWIFTYTIEYEPFPAITPTSETVACAADLEAPTLPVVTDNCGTELTPTGPVVSTTPSCEGDVTYTYTYTDCENNSQDYVHTITIEYEPFPAIAPTSETVACAADLEAPTLPVVTDNCGAELTPTGPVVSATPSCEGDLTYTYTYTDCAGNAQDYVHTITIEYEPFPAIAPTSETVACAADLAAPTILPVVTDNCGAELTPTGPVVSATPSCEGDVTYTYTYTDCAGNAQDYVHTITIEYEPFPAITPTSETVACAADLAAPTLPVVTDNCGAELTPTGPVVSATPSCEGDVTYTYTYTDCAGNSEDYVHTITIDYEPFPAIAPTSETVACAADLTAPTPPVVTDNCGAELTPTGPVVSTTPSCEGDVTYTYTYIDCAGNAQDYVHTITIEYEPFPAIAPTSETVACAADLAAPTLPVVTDNCGAELTPTGPVVSATPSCEGDVTYTYTYTDCAGNAQDYVHTITIEYEPFPAIAPTSETVACAADLEAPT
ncbi:MAG: hypothetical protein AAF433_14390, partial [Bacteroidota bacterium]